MDPEALILMVSFIFITILCIVLGYREKSKVGYLVAMIPFLMFLVVFSVAFLNQRALVWIFMAAAAVVATASLPGVRRFQVRKTKEWWAKYGQEVDLSAPLRLRDLFTTRTGWLRFVYRYGPGKYVLLMWLFMMPTLGGLLLALSLWLKYISIEYIVIYTFTISTGTAIMTYYTLKSALKENKPIEPRS